MKRRKARQLLINPKFQLAVISYALVLAGVVAGTLYGAHHFLASTFIERGKTLGLPEDHVYFRFLSEQQELMSLVFGWTVFISFIVIIIGGLFISHRVAGPLARLKRHLDELGDGRGLKEFKFRDKDFFPELAEAFNVVIRAQKK